MIKAGGISPASQKPDNIFQSKDEAFSIDGLWWFRLIRKPAEGYYGHIFRGINDYIH
jgi:hypothetical protein